MVRRDWANGLEQLQLADKTIGTILKKNSTMMACEIIL